MNSLETLIDTEYSHFGECPTTSIFKLLTEIRDYHLRWEELHPHEIQLLAKHGYTKEHNNPCMNEYDEAVWEHQIRSIQGIPMEA